MQSNVFFKKKSSIQPSIEYYMEAAGICLSTDIICSSCSLLTHSYKLYLRDSALRSCLVAPCSHITRTGRSRCFTTILTRVKFWWQVG